MHHYKKCLIDNWSLQRSASILETGILISDPLNEDTVNGLGGLSNFINAILLYDEIHYIPNGNQAGWHTYSWFRQNIESYINPIIPPDDYSFESWVKRFYSSDYGAGHYLSLSKYFESDLFISSERASKITSDRLTHNQIDLLLSKIDETIKAENSKTWLESVNAGVNANFIFPSLTHYVLSEATSNEDLLTVIMQIKTSGIIESMKNKIYEISKDLKDYNRFQIEIDNLIKSHLGYTIKKDTSWSLKVSVLFLSITKSFDLNIPAKKSHLTFLKDIIACRTETNGLKNDIVRLFKQK